MTKEQRAILKRRAEDAREATFGFWAKATDEQLRCFRPEVVPYLEAADPSVVLAALNTMDALEAENAKLRRTLLIALERMDRARRILTKDNPTPMNNWGMLDATELRAALEESHE